jgi:DNA-3-methyladenine glycosylase II
MLAELIDDRPHLHPDASMRNLPAMDLFGALIFQVIGQQISVIAPTVIFGRLTDRFGCRAPAPDEFAAVDPACLRRTLVPPGFAGADPSTDGQ